VTYTSFSSFLRSTSTLLVVNSYLGLEGGPPIFKQGGMSYFTLLLCKTNVIFNDYKTFTFYG